MPSRPGPPERPGAEAGLAAGIRAKPIMVDIDINIPDV
jgi:hypothetical protein